MEPEELVDVGAQVMGLILAFGPDPLDPAKSVDYNSVVRKAPCWRRSTPPLIKPRWSRRRPRCSSRKPICCSLRRNSGRQSGPGSAPSLLPTRAISDTDYDVALSDYESAKANVAVGVAAIRQNKACVDTARINLGYCTIRSPVAGTIVERRVNIGQTVVAALNAPSLFLIARDLNKMQVWASVNEADIGGIRLGMPVQFTVDAHGARHVPWQSDPDPNERSNDAKRCHLHRDCNDR